MTALTRRTNLTSPLNLTLCSFCIVLVFKLLSSASAVDSLQLHLRSQESDTGSVASFQLVLPPSLPAQNTWGQKLGGDVDIPGYRVPGPTNVMHMHTQQTRKSLPWYQGTCNSTDFTTGTLVRREKFTKQENGILLSITQVFFGKF